MAIPKYEDLYNVYLEAISDGNIHPVTDCQEYIRDKLRLSIEDISEKSSTGAYRWVGRVNWASFDLKDAGAIIYPKQGYVQITDVGKKLLSMHVKLTKKILTAASANKTPEKTQQNVKDNFDAAYKEVNLKLAAELLKLLFNMDAKKFESFVMQLMARMGYGVGKLTDVVKDAGCCGVIYNDRLGFDRVAVYAKHFAASSMISKLDIQRLANTLAGINMSKGLFITTAKFSVDAKKVADEQRIVLIDGKRLTELMFEFDFGVATQKVYKLKILDSEFDFWE